MNSKIYFLIYFSHDKKLIWNTFTIHKKKPWKKFGQNYKPRHLHFLNCLCDASTSQKSAVSTLGNVSTRRSWFTYGMADRAELDQGRGLRAKCKSLSKTTWKHDERRQNNSDKNAFQRFASSFVSFLRRKHDFRRRSPTFVWRILSKNPEFEPLASTGELAFWSPWPQLKNVLTCAVAVMLQKYFRLASVVPRTSGA